MSYIKQTWANGDIITAEKLNHIEDGIASGTLVIGGFSYDRGFAGESDKTWQEIDDALAAGAKCVIVGTYNGGHVQQTVEITTVTEGEYGISGSGGDFTATTTSADGYPAAESEPDNPLG